MSGPIPKRSSQRRRTNSPKADTVKVAGTAVRAPRAKAAWHPIAKQWFQSLAKSGQAVFYEPSDWATAVVIAESISRELSPQPIVVGHGDDARIEMVELPPKGASLAAWLKAMTALLVTEGDRRRAQLELQRSAPAEGEVAGVSELDEYRNRVAGSGAS